MGGEGMVKNYGQTPPSHPNMRDLFNRTICGKEEPVWDTTQWIPDLVVINLGTNDYSTKPHPTDADFMNAYVGFSNHLKTLWPKVKQVFHSGPMWCCHVCGTCCDIVHRAASAQGAGIVDMLCQDYSGKGLEYLVGCAGHPSVLGHRKMLNGTIPV